MARHDVYVNESAPSRKRFPYFLVAQSDLLEGLATVVIVPLGKPAVVEGKLAQTLTPRLDVGRGAVDDAAQARRQHRRPARHDPACARLPLQRYLNPCTNVAS